MKNKMKVKLESYKKMQEMFCSKKKQKQKKKPIFTQTYTNSDTHNGKNQGKHIAHLSRKLQLKQIM